MYALKQKRLTRERELTESLHLHKVTWSLRVCLVPGQLASQCCSARWNTTNAVVKSAFVCTNECLAPLAWVESIFVTRPVAALAANSVFPLLACPVIHMPSSNRFESVAMGDPIAIFHLICSISYSFGITGHVQGPGHELWTSVMVACSVVAFCKLRCDMFVRKV